MKPATMARWTDLRADSPMEKLERRRIIGEHAMISHISLAAGFTLASHAHANEQFCVVLSGSLRFTLDEPAGPRTLTVGAGEVLHLPPNLPHAAEALEDSVVLDIFSPSSEKTGIDRA